MKRSGMPQRKTAMARGGRVRARNVARQKKEKARAYGSPARKDWMHAHGCLVCARNPVEIAHVGNGGMGRKADASQTVPLCHDHHALSHTMGVESFQRTFAHELCFRTLLDWANQYHAAWQNWERCA